MSLDLKRPPKFAPRPPRRNVHRYTVMLLPDDREVCAMITNLSNAGFTAVAAAPPVVLSEFGIGVGDMGIVRAQVRWVDGQEFGAQFERSLSDEQVAAF